MNHPKSFKKCSVTCKILQNFTVFEPGNPLSVSEGAPQAGPFDRFLVFHIALPAVPTILQSLRVVSELLRVSQRQYPPKVIGNSLFRWIHKGN